MRVNNFFHPSRYVVKSPERAPIKPLEQKKNVKIHISDEESFAVQSQGSIRLDSHSEDDQSSQKIYSQKSMHAGGQTISKVSLSVTSE